MKLLKVTFLFFCICTLFLNHSCNRNQIEKKEIKPLLDSVDVFINKMRNENFDFKTRLNYANKALQETTNNTLDKRTIELLNYKIYLLGNLSQYDSAIYTSNKLLPKLIERDDPSSIGKLYSSLAYYYNSNFQKDSAYHYYILSNNIFSIVGDSVRIGENLSHIALIQAYFGDYQGSDATAIESLKLIGEDNIDYITFIYNRLAVSSRARKDYNEALYWYDKALNSSSINLKKISYLQNKAITFRDLKKYNESISILDSLSKVEVKNIRLSARIIDNLAYVRWLSDNDKDPSNLLKALNLRIKDNDLTGLNASYSHLTEFYKKENPKLALLYASKMYQLASSQKSSRDQLDALHKLIDLDKTDRVKEYYASYIRISDSINDAEGRAKNKFAKLKYDSERNRDENLKLNLEKLESKLELEKEKTNNILGAVSSGTVVIGLLAFVFYRRKKHKQEKREEVYKTETRIAKKIHDEVANNVVNVMNKIQYTSEPKEVLLDNLEEVYMLTRDISHQNNTIETGESFESSLKTLLTSFITNTTSVILKDINNVELKLLVSDKQIEIYRILQELMVNMQKHSKATIVVISFKESKNQYSINYSDNGVGIKLNELSLKNGLKNVETRIKSINGVITFETSLKNGFKAFISFKR
jgi:signal transduction histidine kinase